MSVSMHVGTARQGEDLLFVRHCPTHCYLLDANRRIIDVSRIALDQLQMPRGQLLGMPFHPLLHGPACTTATRMLNDTERDGQPHRARVTFTRSHEHTVTLLLCAGRLPADRKNDSGFVVMGSDITAISEELRRSQSRAILDPLTRTYNRRFLDSLLRHETARGTRCGHPTGFVMADIDDFKCINDQWGHRRGDEALRLVAKRLQRGLRQGDVLIRYGGDEFLAVLPETGGGVHCAERRLAQELASVTMPVRGGVLPLRVTLGSSFWVPNADGIAMLDAIAEADARLYAARREARKHRPH